MKCFRGFLLEKDKDTKKEAPFFLKVRNEDIVISQKMDIDTVLARCSNTWDLISANSYYDRSVYMFHLSRESIENDPYWTTPISTLTSDDHYPTVTYTIYHIDGEPSMIDVDFNWYRKFSDTYPQLEKGTNCLICPTFNIRLPYALPSIHPNFTGDRISWNEKAGLTPFTVMTSQGFGDGFVVLYNILPVSAGSSDVQDPSISEKFGKKTGLTDHPGKAFPAPDIKFCTEFRQMDYVQLSGQTGKASSYTPYQEISANMRFFLRDNNPYPLVTGSL